MTVSKAHREYLRAQAINDTVIDAVCGTEPDGMVFNFVGPTGRMARQKRLDNPRDPASRFVGPAGVPSVMPVPPGHDALVGNDKIPLVLVEGSKGILAAASALEGTQQPPLALVGVLGCWGWSSDGRPTEDLMGIPCNGRDVVIMFDADSRSNRHVWDAAEALSDQLMVVKGAASVKFATIPGKDKDGLDDLLASVPPAEREGVLRRMVRAAKPSLGQRPARPRPDRPACFDQDGNFLAMTCYRMLEELHPMACTTENTVAVWRGGTYHNGDSKYFNAGVVNLLGEYFRETYMKTVHEVAVSVLKTTGRVIPVHPDQLLINVRNGLLDPVTLTLHPHDPDYLSMFQFDVIWDKNATCPTYDWWIEQVIPGRAEELEDAVAPMLNPLMTPSKAVFMYGPSRSGKSTYGRLLAAMVGKESTSAVSLQQLSDDRFAAANLYGKVLNLAMDLSSRDVRDLSLFKMMTGDDLIPANRKYGNQFTFTSTALAVFSANEVPTVSETSKAWTARVAPFKFPNSFFGAEDPSIEARMMDEMQGIFRRLVLALRAHLARGGYIDTGGHEDAQEFQRKTNRVSEFLHEKTEPSVNPVGTLRPELYAAYKVWTVDNGGHPLGRNKFFESARTLGVAEFKPENGSWRFGVVLRDPERAGRSAVPDPLGSSDPSPPCGKGGNEDSDPLRKGHMGDKLPSAERTAERAVFDLETCSAAELWTRGPDFARIVGYETPTGVVVGTDMSVLPEGLIAHNGFQFDFHALARHHSLDVLAAGEAGLLIDTKVLAALADPPPFTMKPDQIEKHYSLNAVAERLGHPGKTDDIMRLAEKHGGFDKIPLDDPEYRQYCHDHVVATRAILDALPEMNDYARREMRLLARLASSVTGIGFRIDTDLLDARYAEGQQRLAERRQWLIDTYGMPTARKDGKQTLTPQKTEDGKEAILAAFKALGADPTDWPSEMRTRAGGPSLGKGAMTLLIDRIGADRPEAAELARVVTEMNGVRTVYGNVLDNLADGRVHPTISARQASGRLSITKPGLTVMGKREGRWIEREVFLPEPDHVIVPFDLDQVDARAVAGLCQDPAYMALFTDPTIDSHEEIAYRLWGVRDGKKGVRRNMAKVISHAWNYGAGIARIAATTGIPEAEVEVFDKGMRTDFPGLVRWKAEMAEQARAGSLMDNDFGRMMRPDPERAHTQGPALMGQGAARDLMMGGILRLPIEVVPMLRAVVHDEIVLSIPQDVLDDVIPVVQAALADNFHGIPITAGYEPPARNWGSCYAPKEKRQRK